MTLSTFIKIACDQCHKELDVDTVNDDLFDYGWGKLKGYDEHYCLECWPVYCHENRVNLNTGEDVS